MKTTMNATKTYACLALTLLTLAGCESAREYARKQQAMDAFPPEDDTRSYRRFVAAQDGVGARHDGMLYAYHFDGEQLNSLGTKKLAMMLKDNDRAWPLVVYMNVPDDERLKVRESAVTQYMTDSGLLDNQLHFEVGSNPNATSSGAQNLARLSKTESESPVASNPTNSSSPGYGTGGGAGADSGGGAAK